MRSATRIALAAATAGALVMPATAAATPYSDAVLSSGPLSYMQLDETTGLTALDSSSNHRDGTYVDSILGASGAFGGSHSASLGVGSSINALVDARAGSVQMWVKPTSTKRQQSFAAHGDPRGDGWAVGIGARRKVVFVSGGKTVDSKLSLAAGRWTMLSVTWDGDKVRFYANGGATMKHKPMSTAVPTSSRGDFQIGSDGSGSFSEAFQGGVDDVAVFPAPLNAEAIKGHFAATSLPINTAAPTIAGDVREGSTLTVTPGSYQLETATSRDYEWQRCDSLGDNCEELTATGTTYALTSADVGSTMQVAETAQNAVGSVTTISEPTAVVAAAPVAESGTTQPTNSTGITTNNAAAVESAGGAPLTTTPTTTTTTTTPTAGPAVTCARVVYTTGTPRTLRKRISGVGRVTFSARAKSTVRPSSPLVAAVATKRGKLRKVTFRLDAKQLRTDRKAPYTASIKPEKLAPGKHVLSARVVARNGRTKTLTLNLKTRGC